MKRKRGSGLLLALMIVMILFTGISSSVEAAMPESTPKAHHTKYGDRIGYYDDGYLYWADRIVASSAGVRWHIMGYRVKVTANGRTYNADYSIGGGMVAPYKAKNASIVAKQQNSGGYHYSLDGLNYNTLIKDITAKNATLGRDMSSGNHDVKIVFDAITETYNAGTKKRIGGPYYTAATLKTGLKASGMSTTGVDNYYGMTINIKKANLPIVKYVTKAISFPNGGGYFHTGKTYYVKPGKLVYIDSTYKSQKVNMTNQYLILGDRRGSGIEDVDDYSTNFVHSTGKFNETNGSNAITWSTNSNGPKASNANANSKVRNAFSFVKNGETWWAYGEAKNKNGIFQGGSSADYEEMYGFHTDGAVPTFSGIPASTWRNSNLTFTPVANDARAGLDVSTLTVNTKLAQTITSPAARTTKATFTARTATGTSTYIIVATDNVGNKATQTFKVNIDKVAPTGNLAQTPTTATNGNVTLNLTGIADTGGSGYYRTKRPDGTFVTTATASEVVTKNGTYSFVIYDNAGNATTKSITVSNIDKTAPTGNIFASSTAWRNTTETLNVTEIADTGGSGYYRTKLPDGRFTSATTAYIGVTVNGTYSFVIYDNAGNTTTKTIKVSNIDKTVPTGNLAQTPTAATNGNVTLNLTAIADAGGSGYYRTKLPNGTFVTGTSASQTVTANGTYSFVIYDNAKNSTTKTITVSNIDKTAPTGNLAQTPTAATNGNVTLNLTAIADAGGSGYYRTKLPNGSFVTTTTASQAVTANGTYSFVIYDKAGNSTTKSITVSNIDKTAPTGNLAQTPTAATNGNVTLNLTAIKDTGGSGYYRTKLPNGTYVTTATASQAVTANGTYSFVIYDKAGNSTTKNITVSNIDKTAPTGNLAQTPTAATNGNVTLNLTAIADAGGSGYYRTKLPNGTYVTTTTASQAVTANGTYSFVIYDKAGNSTTKSITVSNIDKTAPTGNLAQTPTAWTNGNVTLNLTAIKDTGGSGYYRTKLPNGAYVTTATASQAVTANGTYSFVIYDKAGNSTTKSITVTNIDKVAPTGNLVQTPTAWTNGNVTLNLTAIKDTGGSGLKNIKLPNGTLVTGTTASQAVTVNGTYSFVIYDNAGNSTTKSITVTNIDKVAPSGNLVQTPTTATNGNVTLKLTGITDTGGSGLKNTKLPNGTLVTGTTASQVVTANGTYVFTMYDNAGNARTNSITVSNIDKTVPTGNLAQTPTAATNGNVTLNLTAIADAGGSGYYRTKLPNGTYVTTTTASQVVTANGTYSFVIYDKAGNSTTKSITVSNIDKTAPTGNLVQTPTGWTKGNVTLNLTAIADAGGSGYYRTKLPNGTFVTTTTASQVVTANGSYSFVIYDKAGNSTTKSITVTNIDKNAPTGNLAQTPTAWTNGNVTLNLTAIADTGGSAVKNIKLPNGTLVTGTTASQVVTVNGTYSFVITDNAGNSTTKSITVTNIDKVAPTGNLGQTPTAWTNGNVTLNLTSVVDTGGSAVKNIKLPNGTIVTTATASQVVTANGTYSFVITDNAGNTTTKSITVGNIDKVKPGGTVTFVPGDTALTIRYTGTDKSSGVKSITLPDKSVVSGSIATYNVTKPGTYTAIVEDNAGNKENIVATVQAPNVTITKEVGDWTNRDAYGLTVKTAPRYVTNAKIQASFEGTSWATGNTRTSQISKNGTYEFKVNDGGIVATGSISITNFDRQKSIITIQEKAKSDSKATYTIRITEVGDVKP